MRVVLVYPYFNEELDRSIFRYPPLGLGYLASVLRGIGIEPQLLDCTFSQPGDAVEVIKRAKPDVVGIYSMVTMNHHAIRIARSIRNEVPLIVAGGPLPSITPESFLDIFDIVVRHEGEETFLELVERIQGNKDWYNIKGIAYRDKSGNIIVNDSRPYIAELDTIPHPARDLFPNEKYKEYWNRYHEYTATSMMSTRGCPYACDFCSNPVYGRSYREYSAQSVVEEMKQIEELGYDRVFFQDDCFTLNPDRVEKICDTLVSSELNLDWMCLSRADTLTPKMAERMARAGCVRVFFGIESGNERMLEVMNKQINLDSVTSAIHSAKQAGIETGGFFILGYPGETDNSLLETLRFSSKLPLDYLSYSFPYPIVGTGLYTKVRAKITDSEWKKQRGKANRHQLLFKGDFSEEKLRFAKNKGTIQHYLRKYGILGNSLAHVFEKVTDKILPHLS
ncbi:B12-binding domain-containing radical SAM protein [Candidatus Thorarchaeota archaeon]|nr:MAG: B12-binding domain-containing radical SAM protein [Candidatus Thorarchaeota archaeon]